VIKILSFGAGVNSTAIIALDHIVFSDTGAEYPHTYCYLQYLKSQGINMTILTGGIKGMTLIEWCKHKKYIPSIYNRWCTDYWKIQPLRRFCQSLGEDYRLLVGVDAREIHRAKPKKNYEYPLVEMGLNRNDCRKVILDAGLELPQKSGCFICPFQKKEQWIELKRSYPELWRVAVELEREAPMTYKYGMTIEEFVEDQDKQEKLPFDFEMELHCFCEN